MGAYALITAAHNEEKYIERTLRSVTSQTVLPGQWIIVSDGSTDRTYELAQRYAENFPFIRVVRREKNQDRNFASQVLAQNAGIRMLRIEEFDFVGLLDADLSFGPTYFHDLFDRFRHNLSLGLAGGFIYEEKNGQFIHARGNRKRSVAGAVQMFRRECLQDVRPFLPIKHGGGDACAEITCRMKGWRVQSFPELEVRHHRPTGSAGGLLRSWYRQGFMDYSIGYHPIFEAAILARRIPYRPFLLGALARSYGFLVANLRHEKRMVSPEFVSYVRMDQMKRLRTFGQSERRKDRLRPARQAD
jgi:glycosyltransferase involved in cell wall biosynthesis